MINFKEVNKYLFFVNRMAEIELGNIEMSRGPEKVLVDVVFKNLSYTVQTSKK